MTLSKAERQRKKRKRDSYIPSSQLSQEAVKIEEKNNDINQKGFTGGTNKQTTGRVMMKQKNSLHHSLKSSCRY